MGAKADAGTARRANHRRTSSGAAGTKVTARAATDKAGRGRSAKSRAPVKARAPAAKKAVARKPAEPEPFTLGKLGQVALTATDMNKAVAFYSDVLGLKLIARFDPPGLAFFKLGGGARLLLSATASEASLYFNVDDLDASVKRLRKRGVRFLQKPAMIHRDEDGNFGRKGGEEWMAFFNDPSGNLLALVERR